MDTLAETKTDRDIRAVPVWDLPARLAHWSLAGGTLVALATGLMAPEWWLPVHVWLGVVAGLALLARLVWGRYGRGPSRFSAFVLNPRAVWGQLVSIQRREAQHFFGHPPAGALMAVLLLAGVGLVVVSGVVAYGGQEKLGPLAGLLGGSLGETAAEVHELAAWGALVLVVGHLLGVVVESRLTGESLAKAMVTGRRRTAAPPGPRERHPARPRAALAVGLGVAGPLGLAWLGVAQLPPRGAPLPVHNARYEKACDDCHMAYPPSLLPADSWRQLMGSLNDHFGENAFVLPETRKAVTSFLTAHAAGSVDTEAARHFRRVNPDRPLRMTATPYWRRRHDALPDSLFQNSPVGARSHCKACHRDAATGWFRDSAIGPPKTTKEEKP